ncbi:Hypothetical protein Cp262_2144 [Corynebacterium pseudotuberculosis]|nr:Hypothetical protein Cp262_2144 [Corynebacterium pseudotuberculosis]ATB61645.1 Hypothetical protein BFF96_0757 [Corynebacterium pseudotuberculosis]
MGAVIDAIVFKAYLSLRRLDQDIRVAAGHFLLVRPKFSP